jgi:O-antigen ligase
MKALHKKYCFELILLILWLLCAIVSVNISIIILPFLWIFSIKYKGERVGFKNQIVSFMILLLGIINVCFSHYSPNTVEATLSISVILIINVFVSKYLKSKTYFHWLFQIINIVSFVFSITTLLCYAFHHYSMMEVGFIDLTNFKHYYRPWGCPSNEWTTFMFLFLPYSLYMYFQSGRWRVLNVLNMILITLCIIVSYSRGLYIAYWVLLVTFGLGLIINKDKDNLVKYGKLLMVVMPVLLLFIIPIRSNVMTTLAMNKTESQQRSVEARIERWQLEKEIVSQNVCFGVGMGNYVFVSQKVQKQYETMFSVASNNTYLRLLYEQGVIGLLGYLSLSLLYLVYLYKRRKELLSVVFLSVFVSMLVREFVYDTIFNVNYVMAMFALLIILSCHYPLKNNLDEKVIGG